MDDKPEALREAGWDGLLAWHEAGHAVMLLSEGLRFEKIDMKPNREQGYAAAVLGQATSQTEHDLTGDMKAAAAGSPAGRKGSRSARRYQPLARDDIRCEIETSGGEPCDFRRVRYVGGQLAALGVESGIEQWISVCQLAERQITGPLWPAVEALAVDLLIVRRALGELGYDQAAAIVSPLLPGVT